MPQFKICFTIDKETEKQVKSLPRNFNLSEELRKSLKIIIAKEGGK